MVHLPPYVFNLFCLKNMHPQKQDITNNNLSLNWLDYETHRKEIIDLRQNVFVKEQGLGEFVLDSPIDKKAIHLGLLDGEKLVSCITIFPFKKEGDYVKDTLKITSERPYIVQFSRRVELREYRSKGISTLILAHAIRSIYEFFTPDCFFAILLGPHKKIKDRYISAYNFNRWEDIETEHGDGFLLILDDQNNINRLVSQLKSTSIDLSEELGVQLPDLTYFIHQNKNLKEYLKLKGDMTNRYLAPLSLRDELPRLSAQARMLFASQEEIWRAILEENPNYKNILDLGCGPGVYLSQLKKIDKIKELSLTGMDISSELITYARFSHPEMEWKEGSIYETNIDSESVDIAHCSFVFIHLMNPFLALKEIYRILSPGGIFYISDVNDSTFEGPQQIKDLIHAHNEIYEGNRRIMSSIQPLAEKAGFHLVKSSEVLVDNTGSDDGPKLEQHHYKLGKWTMWGMFSFLGQRSEVQKQFGEADQHYFDSNCDISIKIQSKIFRKE